MRITRARRSSRHEPAIYECSSDICAARNPRSHRTRCSYPSEVEIFRFLLPLILAARSTPSPAAHPQNSAFRDAPQIRIRSHLLAATLTPHRKRTRSPLTRNAHPRPSRLVITFPPPPGLRQHGNRQPSTNPMQMQHNLDPLA
jgi:hypothetical protein